MKRKVDLIYMESMVEENWFKKAYKLSWISRFKASELWFLALAFAFPLILFSKLEIIYIVNVILFISIALTILGNKIEYKRQWNPIHKWTLGFSGFVQIFGIVISIMVIGEADANNPILLVMIVLGFFAYIGVSFAFLIFSLNILFFIILKFIFPYDSGELYESRNYRLAELSPYISLPNQVAYLFLTILHTIMYLVFVTLVLGWITKLSKNHSENNTIENFEMWIINSGLITLGNTFAIVSILLTLLTITVPFNFKVINAASKKLERSC